MAASRVLVTRPQPGAEATGHKLASAGFAPILLPLSEIVPLAIGNNPPAGIDAVIVTSANAVRHLPESWRKELCGLPVLAVGEATATLCRTAGFTQVHEGSGDARGLAGLAVIELGKGAQVFYLCGRVRLPDLEHALEREGIVVTTVETYDTRIVEFDEPALDALLGTEPIAAVLLYSREAALNYARMLAHPGIARVVMTSDHICLSSRVASGLEGTGAKKISIAERPTEEALIALLPGQSLLQPRTGLFSA